MNKLKPENFPRNGGHALYRAEIYQNEQGEAIGLKIRPHPRTNEKTALISIFDKKPKREFSIKIPTKVVEKAYELFDRLSKKLSKITEKPLNYMKQIQESHKPVLESSIEWV